MSITSLLRIIVSGGFWNGGRNETILSRGVLMTELLLYKLAVVLALSIGFFIGYDQGFTKGLRRVIIE